MTTLNAGSATDVGRTRDHNEDSKLVVAAVPLFAVADGMGGHQGGEVASGMAVETLAARAIQPNLEDLKAAVKAANRAIFEKAGSEAGLYGMGTTICALRLVDGPEGDEIAWVNVGDSRVYLLRDDRLIQLSTDHSLVEDLLRDGQLTPEEAAVHPKRNIITRALGIDVDVDVDGATVLPYTGDRFVLASDGLFGEISDDQITSVLRRLADPTEAAEELVRQANEAGGRDNITVVIVEVVDDGGRSAAASEALSGEPTTAIAVVEAPEPEAEPEPEPELFAGRASSLPRSEDDYGAEKDDLFDDLDRASAKRWTWRVFAFVLALVAIAGAVVGYLWYESNNSYFVGESDGVVAIYKGTPGGSLFFDPELVEAEGPLLSDLAPAKQGPIRNGVERDSLSDARTYVQDLIDGLDDEADDEATTTTTVPGTTTTTTAATSSTTTAPVTTTAPAATSTAAPGN